MTHLKKVAIERHRSRTNNENKNRKFQISYFLSVDEVGHGIQIKVCRTFFLTTLGYSKSNNSFITSILRGINELTCDIPKETRGTTRNGGHILDREKAMILHLKKFPVKPSHYRREHAPLRLYFDSELSIKTIWEDFKINHRDFADVSYETYRKFFATQNISFAKLGCEECETCENHNLHTKACKVFPESEVKCDQCLKYSEHKERYVAARKLYQFHATLADANPEISFYSVDSEKVIMLPRMDQFKDVIFTKRLSVYNEDFVPISSLNSAHPIVAAIWHEAIGGRKQEHIISTYYQFFLELRDKKHIVLWLDNCGGQNKNWALLTFLVFLINSNQVETLTIEIFYFEAGHTFMSADSFHHMVEKSMKGMKNVYDFRDFKKCVSKASTNVTVVDMTPEKFFEWKSFKSITKIENMTKKCLLPEVKHLRATRGSFVLEYSLDYKESATEPMEILDFLKFDIVKKEEILLPKHQSKPVGISEANKTEIQNKLLKLMPSSRRHFWNSLPEKESQLNPEKVEANEKKNPLQSTENAKNDKFTAKRQTKRNSEKETLPEKIKKVSIKRKKILAADENQPKKGKTVVKTGNKNCLKD